MLTVPGRGYNTACPQGGARLDNTACPQGRARLDNTTSPRWGFLHRFAWIAVLFCTTLPVSAQQVTGLGDDALVLPRGTLRLRILGDWTTYSDRFNDQGKRESLGSAYTNDSIGVAQLPFLAPLQTDLRTLTGNTTLGVTLGASVLNITQRITAMPVVIETGISRRVSLGLTVPIVRTRSQLFYNVNPAQTEGNIAINPARVAAPVFNADTLFANQLVRAATAFQTYCTGSGSGDPECTPANTTMAANAITFGARLGQVYGYSIFVPIGGSAEQIAIDTRATNYRQQLNTLASSIPSIPQITGTGVTGAHAPIATPDMQQILVDPAFGIQANVLTSVDRYTLGDLELAAKFSLYDGFDYHPTARYTPTGVKTRLAIGTMLRVPTGRTDSPDNFADISTGTQQWAIGLRAYGDLIAGPRFWASLVARYDISIADDQIMRVTETYRDAYAPAYRRTTVNRKLGNALQIEATPRWIMNDFMSLSAQYIYRHKPSDRYTGQVFDAGPDETTGGTTIIIDPSTLSSGTAFTAHRVGGGIAFSNLAAHAQGRARIPFEVSYSHVRTIKGTGGMVPSAKVDQIQIRLYRRIFGN